MTEAQAKKVFLKQAKPFFKRYAAEQKRKTRRNAKTSEFRAGITPSPAPQFSASYKDLFRGVMTMRVPILFTLPPGFESGFKFTSASEFENFKKYCEDK